MILKTLAYFIITAQEEGREGKDDVCALLQAENGGRDGGKDGERE